MYLHVVLNRQGAILYKNPNRDFLIRKRIFCFFTKTQKRTADPIEGVDSLDPIQNRILWMHVRKLCFKLSIRKEWIQPAATRNNFKVQISCLTTLLIITAIFKPKAWIKRSILFVLFGWLNRNTNRTLTFFKFRNKLLCKTSRDKPQLLIRELYLFGYATLTTHSPLYTKTKSTIFTNTLTNRRRTYVYQGDRGKW